MIAKKTKRKPKERVSLLRVLEEYLLERETGRAYREQMEITLKKLKAFHGGTVYVDDLCDAFMNKFIAWLEDSGLGKETIRDKRGMALTLWRAAFDRELTDIMPRRVRKIVIVPKIPEAWTPAEVQLLVEATDTFAAYVRHEKSNAPVGCFWKALIMTAWDTALRTIDLGRLRYADIGADGVIHIVQHKTGWPLRCQIRPETLAAIQAIDPANREFIFGPSNRRRQLTFRRLVKTAGLTGTFKKLRKSSATAVERLTPGAAKAHLGHKTHGLAERHYIDPRQIQGNKVQPPQLGAAQPVAVPAVATVPGGDILAWI